jgi:small GTP-binding protein
MNNNINQSFNIKIIVIGNSNTGKTSFVKYWTKQHFNEKYKATINSEFEYKIMKINDKIYRINVWDLGGQDNNIHLQKIFTKDCNGVIIFSDLDENNLKATLKWKKNFLDFYEKFNFPVVCVQNKIDLVDDKKLKEISKKFDLFWKENEFDFGFLTSAKKGINVNESMNFIINEIDKKFEQNYLNTIKNNNENIENFNENFNENKNSLLNLEKNTKNKKNCC